MSSRSWPAASDTWVSGRLAGSPADERERQAARECGDETAAVQTFSGPEAHQRDRERGQLSPGVAHPLTTA
jgi:hypothetical protein